MSRLKHALLFILLATTTLSCASHRGSGQFTKEKNHFYTEQKTERQMGEILIPEGHVAHPAVILVHGGGWRSRDLGDMNLIAKSLAEHGFLVFNINYRLAPEFQHPAPIEDLKRAHQYLLDLHQSKKIQIDPERVALWGYSSGGHTVSYYALQADKAGPISAVVSGGAPYDFTWYPLSPYLLAYMGKYRDEMLDDYIQASPVTHIHKKAPSFFLYHGIKDRLVEHAQAAAFQAKLMKAGVPTERYDISFWGHGTAFIFSREAVKRGILFLKEELKDF